jgi:hypothetical protein
MNTTPNPPALERDAHGRLVLTDAGGARHVEACGLALHGGAHRGGGDEGAA